MTPEPTLRAPWDTGGLDPPPLDRLIVRHLEWDKSASIGFGQARLSGPQDTPIFDWLDNLTEGECGRNVFNSDGPTGTVTRIWMAVWSRPTAIPIDLRHTGTISMRCSIPARSPELRV